MSRFLTPLLWLLLLAGLIPTGLKLFGPQPLASAVQPERSALVARPIREITVGTWVKAENPTGEEDLSLGMDVDSPTWRQIELRAPKTDGSHADVTLLRPLSWIESRKVQVGGTTSISVPECGIDGNAEVLAIKPCPRIARSPGKGYRVVTGKFVHHSAKVIDLHVEGLKEPIGTTANHPFWSEDKQQFVRADQLQPGEHLRAFNGTPMVTAAYPRPGPETVYNLEVSINHTYCVAKKGILVHNGGLAVLDECLKLSNKALGNVGEKLAADYLEKRGYKVLGSVQNGSGNGIDLVTEYTTRGGSKRLAIFEIKANGSRLSKAQRKGGKWFTNSRLGRATEEWNSISPESRQLAETVIDRLEGEKAMYSVLRVDLSDLLNPKFKSKMWR